MALVNPSLFQKIRDAIFRRHTAFLLSVFGPKTVSSDEAQALKAAGIVVGPNNTVSIADAYAYGQVVGAIESQGIEDWDQGQVDAWVARHPQAPLSAAELAAIDRAQASAALYVRGLGNVIEKETGQVIIDADHELAAAMRSTIRGQVVAGIEARSTAAQVKSALGHKTGDWTRNLSRIAITETHNALTQGVLDGFRRIDGDDARVSFRPAPGACKHCIKLHIGPDGAPRIFKLSQLAPPGANVGRKASDWQPSMGGVHPHCQCASIRVPRGWAFDEDGELVPGGTFGQIVEDVDDGQPLIKSLGPRADAEERHRQRFSKSQHEHVKTVDFRGLTIVVEQDAGDIRHWRDRNGEQGHTVMWHAYGYIQGTRGDDDEPVDVYMGPDPEAQKVFVVDQRRKTGPGKFAGHDEQKVMLGFPHADAAREAYLAQYDDPGFMARMHELTWQEFVEGLRLEKPERASLSGRTVPESQGPQILVKAGPYIGPRGGKYADPEHKIPWKPQTLSDLPVVDEETWDDGTHVVFHASPFPKGSKPNVPSKLHDTAPVESVALDSLRSSQSRVTAHGVVQHAAKPSDTAQGQDLPLVYRMPDGTHVIGDGHHRLVASRLRGEHSARVRVVDAAPHLTKSGAMIQTQVDLPAVHSSRDLALREWLRDVETQATPDGSIIRRDPEIYLIPNPLGSQLKPIEVERVTGDRDADDNRAMLEAMWERRFLNQHPNTIELDDADLGEPVEKSVDELTKSTAHKYLTKTWNHGHWVYTYPDENARPRIQVSADGKTARAVFTGAHGYPLAHKLAAETGGTIVSDPSTQRRTVTFDRAHLAPKPGEGAPLFKPSTQPAPAAPVPQPAPEPPQKPAKAPKKPAAGLETPVDPKSLQPPLEGHLVRKAGQHVSWPGGQGTVQGYDYAGYVIVQSWDTGQKHTVHPDTTQSLATQAPEAVAKASTHKLAHGKVHKASERQQKLVATAMTMGRAQKVTDYLAAKGHEVYLVGGIVRDLVAMTAKGSKATDAAIKKAMVDVDLASTAPPNVLEQAMSATGPSSFSPTTFKQKGCVTDDVLDLCSLSSGGVYDAPVDNVVPATFDHDLEKDSGRRDFTANCLYYDLKNEAIIDPTGQGIDDARAKVLRRVPGQEWSKNERLVMRFWKFRARGWTADPETRVAIVAQAWQELKDVGSQGMLVSYVGKQIAFSGPPDKAFDDLKAVMAEDGAEHIFQKFIAPHEDAIKAFAKKKAAVKKGA